MDKLILTFALQHLFATLSILGSGKGSQRIDAKAAQKMQTGAEGVGEILVWTIYGSGDKFIARPCMTSSGVTPMPVHLEARTLNDLRAQLPAGLTRTDRLPDDEAVVVESWQ